MKDRSLIIVTIFSLIPPQHCQNTCPPPVGQFITLNGQPYRDSGALIKARKERQALVARLGVKDNQFYSSPKCSVLEDARNDLYSNFGIREEYDPVTFSRSKECIVYVASTDFSQMRVDMTLLLIAEVTPGLSNDCNVYVSSKAGFTVEFCSSTDRSEACVGPGGRNVEFGETVRTIQTNFTDIGDGVVLQREIVVEVNPNGGSGGVGARTSDIEQTSTSSSSVFTEYIVPIILAILIAIVLLLLIILACCWWKGCFSGKDSRPSTIDSTISDDRIRQAVHDEMDHYQKHGDKEYATVNKDGRKLAVINADDLEDGLIIVPGRNKNFSVLEEVNPNDGRRHQVYPLDKKYLKNSGDQTDKLDHSQYSLNVLNLEGDSLSNSFNSRYSRHSYDHNVGGTRRSKQSESSVQTMPETRDENVQADLDHTRTQGLDSSTDSSDLYLPSALGGDDLERELLPIKETKASIARARKISEMNPKDPVHCHYPKNKDHDH